MKTIIENKKIDYIIEKSHFIGLIHKVYSKQDIEKLLITYRKEYNDATHICYAYILPNSKKYHDDGEPLGTAGIPILNVLEKNNLSFVLAIVIRYFGGIKLGSNGLIRAYSHSVMETIQDNIKELEYGYLIQIQEEYKNNDYINYLLKDSQIISRKYQDKIIINALVNKKTLETFSNIHYKIIEEKIL